MRPPFLKSTLLALSFAFFLLETSPLFAIQLSLPLECTLNEDCFIQNYVDISEEGAVDYRCGTLTYEGHKGTDFRILSKKAFDKGIIVRAAADGTVKAVRNNQSDGAPYEEGMNCGNGIVLTHGEGWETQYCHLKQFSVTVNVGAKLKAGDPIGLVGLSGQTEFPHLHFSVRKNNKVIDPFRGEIKNGLCTDSGKVLWRKSAYENLYYVPVTVIAKGISNTVPTLEDLTFGKHLSPATAAQNQHLFWAFLSGLQEGDRLKLTLKTPKQVIATREITLLKNQAQYLTYVGKTNHSFNSGDTARGILEIQRGGETILTSVQAIRF